MFNSCVFLRKMTKVGNKTKDRNNSVIQVCPDELLLREDTVHIMAMMYASFSTEGRDGNGLRVTD